MSIEKSLRRKSVKSTEGIVKLTVIRVRAAFLVERPQRYLLFSEYFLLLWINTLTDEGVIVRGVVLL